MPSHKGRDLLLKIGDNATPAESFATLGAARTASLTLNNQPADATTIGDAGVQNLAADAGVQTMQIRLEGLFKDDAAEETLRSVAFSRGIRNFRMIFPNGDSYTAPFAVDSYSRAGVYDGLETFAVTLTRAGAGTFTAGT